MNEQWYWQMYRLARIQRVYTKQPDEAQLSQRLMSCTHADIALVSSSNIMFRVKNKDHDGFFSLIYRHIDLRAYFERVVNDYYDFVCTEHAFAEHDRALVLRSLADPDGLKKFYHMGNVWVSGSPVSRFMETGDPEKIGLACDPSDRATIERLKVFVRKYAWGALAAYKQNDQIKKNAWQTAAANRTLATQALAKLLGLGYMIPKAEYRWLEIDGKYRCFGLFTERAAGEDITMMPPEKRRAVMTPVLQRDLNRLNMFDVICTEKDHCPENYHILVENGHAAGICVFDNNSAEAFSVRGSVSFGTYVGCSPFVNEQGRIDRPYFDAELAARIQHVSARDIYLALKPYLALLPILMLKVRVDRMKQTIARSLLDGSAEAKENGEWDNETLHGELQRPHGKTYLQSFLCDCFHGVQFAGDHAQS